MERPQSCRCTSKKQLLVILLVLLNVNSIYTFHFDNDPSDTSDPGFFSKIRYYVGEIGTVMNEVATGVQKLNRGIRNFEEFLDATIDEDCQFECPGGKTAVIRKGFMGTFNGCGSFGLEDYLHVGVLPLSEFVECCNTHDLCYAVCGNDKDECDLKFKKCLYQRCSAKKEELGKLQFKGCQAGAKLLYTGTTALGCRPYLKAQDEACECIRENDEL